MGHVPWMYWWCTFRFRAHHDPLPLATLKGERTTNTGAFHESLNLAKIYHLPIVYFVVNNLYGMGLRVEQGSAVSELYRKACAYDMQSWRVDGTDVLAVRDAMRTAATLARERQQPSLVEAVSFRFRGHSVVDPDRYRDKQEVQHEVDAAVTFAEQSPFPSVEAFMRDLDGYVYAPEQAPEKGS